MWNTPLRLWTRTVCITSEAFMLPDVCSSLNIVLASWCIQLVLWSRTAYIISDVACNLLIIWYMVCLCWLYTWDNETKKSASLANHAYILLRIVDCVLCGVFVVCLWNIRLGLWTWTVCISCEPCMHPDVYSSLCIRWCVCVSEYTLGIVDSNSVHHL